ncbi:MAG: gliding motility-associated C-terminal domain-containing protein [Saprospiraceae bacterium]
MPAIDTLQLQPNSPAGGIWTASCGICVSNEGIFDPQNLAAGEYFVRYVQGGICSGTADTFLIQLLLPPTLILSGDTTVFVGEEVPLVASGAQNYLWQTSDNLSCDNCSDPVFTADTTTVFLVMGQDAFGCVATDSLTVTVLPDLKFDMPNAFTPNGDGSNDVFMPAFKGDIFERFYLRVFTRWGELIFESNAPTQGWNGMLKDIALPSDVYVYIFEYGLTDGRSGQEKGDVTLLR